MQSADQRSKNGETRGKRWKSAWAAFFRSRDGTAALEFAILAVPYFLMVFAILETCIAFAAEQMVSNTTESFARRIRTGQITFGLGRSTDMNAPQFRNVLCDEISLLLECRSQEVATPSKLYIDLRTFSDFSEIPETLPMDSSGLYADLDPGNFTYAPGGAGKINMLRVIYRWEIVTDIMRPYLTNVRPASGGMPREFLIVATSTFQNERYP